MDPVRFGRVLGAGARAAAKTVVQAADAAAAPNPSPSNSSARATANPGRASADSPASVGSPMPSAALVETARPAGPVSAGLSAVDPAPGQERPAPAGVREGVRRFGREVWKPTVRLSGVLGLEFAGVFFGVFAVFALVEALRLRSAWHATAGNRAEHAQLLVAVGMLAVFGYFSITSFLRAGRRARRR